MKPISVFSIALAFIGAADNTKAAPAAALNPAKPAAVAAPAPAPAPQRAGRGARLVGSGRRNAGTADWTSNPSSRGAPGPGDRLAGSVAWRATPNVLDMCAQAGFGRGAFRSTLMVHEVGEARFIGADFAAAAARGRATWMTCVGTPASLSPHPELTENEFSTGLPQYARYAPTDAAAWADIVLGFIADIEASYGVAPDYLELWNEPERAEWFTGTEAELFDFYAVAATRLRAGRPGMKIGGPGLAGYSSTMGGTESVLYALVRHAAATNAPLQFVSWHHYAPGNELSFSQVVAGLHALGDTLHLPRFETVVSEWNIYPSAQGATGPEFDGPHAAANYAGFISSAAALGLDRNLYFLDLDEDDDPGITDLAGLGLGMLTEHGIKKPVMRVAEILLGMARETSIGVTGPAEEYSVRVVGSRDGSRVRYVISNDVVTGLWMFANRSRQNGMEPGWLYPLWLAAGGTRATEGTLMAQGLTQTQARAVLGFIPEVQAADRYTRESRPVSLTMSGSAPFRLGEVRRFTSAVNAPALQRAAILPQLQSAEDAAAWASAVAGADELIARGYAVTAQEVASHVIDFFAWASSRGISFGDAVAANRIMSETLRDARLANQGLLNNLPELRLKVETASQAGISLNGRTIQLLLEPNSVIVVDVLL